MANQYGTAGNDTLKGGVGNDTIYGYAGIDDLNGGAGDDYLYGGDGNDSLDGAAGNDYLYGGAGDDILYGGDGNDTLNGGSGKDYLDGGDGIDTADYSYSNADSTYDLITGVASAPGFYEEQMVNFENIITGGGNETVTGTAGDNVIKTGAGNDYLYGLDGNDTLYGEAGDDYLDGGNGDDKLYGGAGDDLLYGGNGDDYLDGGAGNDTLYGEAGKDSFYLGYDIKSGVLAKDTITDFVQGEDKIVLSKTVFEKIATGGGAFFNVFKVGAATETLGANFATIDNDGAALTSKSSAAILYSSSTGNLFYNQDGAIAGLGGPTNGNFANVTGNPILSGSDFSVIA